MHGLEYIGEPRKGRRGGGFALVFNKSRYKAEKLNFGQPPINFEIIICKMSKLEPPVFNQFVFSCYFKPQMTSNDIERALSYIQMAIIKIESKYNNSQLFFGADINHVDINLILNLQPSFRSLNKNPTRGRKNIDVFITNMTDAFQEGLVCPELQVEGLKSDHKQVLIMKRVVVQSISNKEIEYRPILDSGIRDFSEYLNSCQWAPMEALCVDAIVETMDTVINNGLDIFLPVKKKKIKSSSQPWFSRELDKMRRLKASEYKKEGRSLKYKQLDREYQCKLKNVKLEYKNKFLDEAIKAKNPRNAFKALKKLSGVQETQSNFV